MCICIICNVTVCQTESACTYHAGPGLFSNEGIPEDLGQSAHPERNVITVHSQWTYALLQDTRVDVIIYLNPSRGAKKQMDSQLVIYQVCACVCVCSHSLPWEPAGCGWSRQSQPKCYDRCCWRPCRARCRPNRPVKICHAACWRGHCVAGQFGGWHESGMSWHWQRSGLMFFTQNDRWRAAMLMLYSLRWTMMKSKTTLLM